MCFIFALLCCVHNARLAGGFFFFFRCCQLIHCLNNWNCTWTLRQPGRKVSSWQLDAKGTGRSCTSCLPDSTDAGGSPLVMTMEFVLSNQLTSLTYRVAKSAYSRKTTSGTASQARGAVVLRACSLAILQSVAAIRILHALFGGRKKLETASCRVECDAGPLLSLTAVRKGQHRKAVKVELELGHPSLA